MMPRQPDVPKWIVWFVTRAYCIVSPGVQVSGNRGTVNRKSKGAMANQIVVLVTCGSNKEAEKIGRALVEWKLVACANIFRSPVRSIYRWKDKVELASEVLMILKSSRSRFAALDRAIRSLHSYDLPEIIALPITKGSRGYLDWISTSVSGRQTRKVASSSAR